MADLPTVSALADAAILRGDDGWLTPPLQPVVAPATTTMGRVRTVQLMAADTGPGMTAAFELLSSDLTDQVIVWTGVADLPCATWGEILSRAAHGRGARAVLVDGAVRDVDDMRSIGLPVYARGTAVVGPNGTVHATGVDVPVKVGGVVITPGDTVVVDSSGCMRLVAERADDLLVAGSAYAAGETALVSALIAGETLDTAYLHKKRAVDALRR